MLEEELREAHDILEDMWLDLSLNPGYLERLQHIYNKAESLVEMGQTEQAQEGISLFWVALRG